MPRESDIGFEIPGVGTVYFPKEMGQEAINAKVSELTQTGLRHSTNIRRGEEQDIAPTTLEGIDIPGIGRIPGNYSIRPGQTAHEIGEGVRALGSGFGPIGGIAGELFGQGIEAEGGFRENRGYDPLSIAAQGAIPAAIEGVGKAAAPVAKELYGSALKLSRTIKPEKRLRILETGLSEGRVPSTGSIKKSIGAQKEIQNKVKGIIAQEPGAGISGRAVASRIDEVAPRFESFTPEADRAILKEAQEEFMRNYGTKTLPAPSGQIGPSTIPEALTAAEAQAGKKATYQKLGESAYGELKGAQKESMKALARGAKEELEGIWPELKNLNAKDSALFDLNRALAQAANRIGNRDVVGIGIPIKTAAFGTPGFLLGLMDSPNIKAGLAVALNKARHLQGITRATTLATRAATMPSSYEKKEPE